MSRKSTHLFSNSNTMPPKGKTLDELLRREPRLPLIGHLPDGSPVYYNHKHRHTINKKLWLNDQNDIFFFLTPADSPWQMSQAMLVREESYRDHRRWLEGSDVKFIQKCGCHEYNNTQDFSAGPSSSANAHTSRSLPMGAVSQLPPVTMKVTACRMHRLPWEVPRDSKSVKVFVFLVFTHKSEPDNVMSLLGKLSRIVGQTGQDVKETLEKCADNPHIHLMCSPAFYLSYDHREKGDKRVEPTDSELEYSSTPPSPPFGFQYRAGFGPPVQQSSSNPLADLSDLSLSPAPSPTHSFAIPGSPTLTVSLSSSPSNTASLLDSRTAPAGLHHMPSSAASIFDRGLDSFNAGVTGMPQQGQATVDDSMHTNVLHWSSNSNFSPSPGLRNQGISTSHMGGYTSNSSGPHSSTDDGSASLAPLVRVTHSVDMSGWWGGNQANQHHSNTRGLTHWSSSSMPAVTFTRTDFEMELGATARPPLSPQPHRQVTTGLAQSSLPPMGTSEGFPHNIMDAEVRSTAMVMQASGLGLPRPSLPGPGWTTTSLDTASIFQTAAVEHRAMMGSLSAGRRSGGRRTRSAGGRVAMPAVSRSPFERQLTPSLIYPHDRINPTMHTNLLSSNQSPVLGVPVTGSMPHNAYHMPHVSSPTFTAPMTMPNNAYHMPHVSSPTFTAPMTMPHNAYHMHPGADLTESQLLTTESATDAVESAGTVTAELELLFSSGSLGPRNNEY